MCAERLKRSLELDQVVEYCVARLVEFDASSASDRRNDVRHHVLLAARGAVLVLEVLKGTSRKLRR